MNDEGPRTFTIPARRETTCSTCKYHHCFGALCTRSGSGGYRDYSCKHPKAWDSMPADTPKQAELRGQMRESERNMCGGRLIGRTEQTPEWCPYLREENNRLSNTEK